MTLDPLTEPVEEGDDQIASVGTNDPAVSEDDLEAARELEDDDEPDA